jgi:hypothetical protein
MHKREHEECPEEHKPRDHGSIPYHDKSENVRERSVTLKIHSPIGRSIDKSGEEEGHVRMVDLIEALSRDPIKEEQEGLGYAKRQQKVESAKKGRDCHGHAHKNDCPGR